MKFLAFLLVIAGAVGIVLFFEGTMLAKWGVFRHVSANTFIGSSLGGLMLGFILIVAPRSR